MERKIKEIEKIIKYNFKKLSLLETALTHKSFDNNINNEKLEFLGDRVLGLVISEKLLNKFPDEKEGIIDKKFANLVNKKTCLLIARKINLKKFIFLAISKQVFLLTKLANFLSIIPSFSSGNFSKSFSEITKPKTLSPKNSNFSLLILLS